MDLSPAYFKPLIGQEFDARVDGTDFGSRLVLREVIAGKRHETTRQIRKEPFRLIFHGPIVTQVARKIVHLSRVGESDSALIYVEPMSVSAGVVEYEVIVG